MSDPVEFTGERFTPDCEREIWYEHWHRYVLACEFVDGASVLDVACGDGYGSELLAREADYVVAVDLSANALFHAARAYGGRTNLGFLLASCDALALADASFDVVVSFETIEHVTNQRGMLAEIRRVMKDDGLLILSSPNKKAYSDDRGYRNEFHVKELYLHELKAVLAEYFPAVRIFDQKLLFHSAIWEQCNVPSRVTVVSADREESLFLESVPYEAMYFIALCGSREQVFPTVDQRLWLFADDDESVTRHYEQVVAEGMRLDGLLSERERVIAERDTTLDLRTQQMAERERIIEQRDRTLEETNRRVIQREQLIAERDEMLALRTQQMQERDATIAMRTRQIHEQQTRIESSLAESTRLRDSLVQNQALQAQLEAKERDLLYRDSLQWWVRRPFRPLKRWLGLLREALNR